MRHPNAVHQIEARPQDMRKTYDLYLAGQLSVQGFGDLYRPVEERVRQLETELPKLEAEVGGLQAKRPSAQTVMAEAIDLYDRWPRLPLDERRKIAEALCEKIIIGERHINITYSFTPVSKEPCKSLTML